VNLTALAHLLQTIQRPSSAVNLREETVRRKARFLRFFPSAVESASNAITMPIAAYRSDCRHMREARPEPLPIATDVTTSCDWRHSLFFTRDKKLTPKFGDRKMWNIFQMHCNGRARVYWVLDVILISGFATLSPNAPVAVAGERAERAGLIHQQSSEPEGEAAKPVDPQLSVVLDKMAAAGIVHPRTVDEVRKAYPFYSKLSGNPQHIFRVEDRLIPGPAGKIPVRLYTPHEGRGLPLLVFFHGGGFVAGSLDTHDTALRTVANRCGCIVVSVAYRLAPENPYPAAPDDAYAATKWVADHAAEIGGDAQREAVAGDDAGGNLAAVVALMARDRGEPHLVYQVLIYPLLDAVMRTSWYLSNDPILTPDAEVAILVAYVPVTRNLGHPFDLNDPYISPIYAKSLKNLPRTLVVTDEDDPARDEGDAYASRLAQDGVQVRVSRYSSMIHGFFLMAGALDAGEKCLDEIGVALTQAFESAPISK
jgi:acetyl esterase